MFRLGLILFLLAALTLAAINGQTQPLPGQWQNQFPKSHEQPCAAEDSEIVRLNQLVNEQKNKIALLEEKVKLLEIEIKRAVKR